MLQWDFQKVSNMAHGQRKACCLGILQDDHIRLQVQSQLLVMEVLDT